MENFTVFLINHNACNLDWRATVTVFVARLRETAALWLLYGRAAARDTEQVYSRVGPLCLHVAECTCVKQLRTHRPSEVIT